MRNEEAFEKPETPLSPNGTEFIKELLAERAKPDWIKEVSSISEFPEMFRDPKVQAVFFAAPPHPDKTDFELLARKRIHPRMGLLYPAVRKRVHRAMLKEREELLTAFRGAELKDELRFRYDKKKTQDKLSWHRDIRHRAKWYGKRLILIRTYAGPSTWYAEDFEGKNAVKLPDGAIVIHRGGPNGAIHKEPVVPPGTPRFLVITEIKLAHR